MASLSFSTIAGTTRCTEVTMRLDDLIQKLQDTQVTYPGSCVFVATSAQILRSSPPNMNAVYQLPIADGSCLGDQDGEVDSLFIVTMKP